MASLNI